MLEFNNIKFEEHRLEGKGIHGIYPINENWYVSVCSGGGAYGDLNKYDRIALIDNDFSIWTNRIKSTFEVALCNKVQGDIELIDGEPIQTKLSVNDVELFIKKVKQMELR